jgi:hypothetical protein
LLEKIFLGLRQTPRKYTQVLKREKYFLIKKNIIIGRIYIYIDYGIFGNLNYYTFEPDGKFYQSVIPSGGIVNNASISRQTCIGLHGNLAVPYPKSSYDAIFGKPPAATGTIIIIGIQAVNTSKLTDKVFETDNGEYKIRKLIFKV